MKKVVTGSIFATLLAASTAFAFELPASQPTKHEPEGPDTSPTQHIKPSEEAVHFDPSPRRRLIPLAVPTDGGSWVDCIRDPARRQ